MTTNVTSQSGQSDFSMFNVIGALNSTMLESAVLGNTVAQHDVKQTQSLKPLYDDMFKQAKVIGKMEEIMQVVQPVSIALLGLGALGGVIGAIGASIATGASMATMLTAAESAVGIVSSIAQAGTSMTSGMAKIGETQATVTSQFDQAKADSISDTTSKLMTALKESSNEKQAIAQSTAVLINGNAAELTAYKYQR